MEPNNNKSIMDPSINKQHRKLMIQTVNALKANGKLEPEVEMVLTKYYSGQTGMATQQMVKLINDSELRTKWQRQIRHHPLAEKCKCRECKVNNVTA